MGVIEKNNKKVGGFQSSSQESLHIPQSSEDERSVVSVDEVQVTPLPIRVRNHMPRPMYFVSPRKRLGKKKSRHQQNVSQLMTLLEEDEELGEVTIHDFVPNNHTWFSSILNNSSDFEAWSTFTNLSEEIQREILEECEVKPVLKKNHRILNNQELSGEEAFMNIKSGLRNKLKRTTVPQGMVNYLEKSVVDSFTVDSTTTFMSEVMSSFERLLLHTIAQYHRLNAQSIESDMVANAKQVKVTNLHHEVYTSPKVLLGQFLEEKQKQKYNLPVSTGK